MALTSEVWAENLRVATANGLITDKHAYELAKTMTRREVGETEWRRFASNLPKRGRPRSGLA